MISILHFFRLYILLLILPPIDSAFLRSGNPLTWRSSKPHLNSVRISGVQQFLAHYNRCKEVEMKSFLWGDEIESGIFERNLVSGVVDLALSSGTRTRSTLTERENSLSESCPVSPPSVLDMFTSTVLSAYRSTYKRCGNTEETKNVVTNGCEWQPEYGSWMIEAVPRSPYDSNRISDFLNVEKSMQLRRKRLHSALAANELAPTMSNFPMMGVPGYSHTAPIDPFTRTSPADFNSISQSTYVSDELINPHPRFGTLTQNIRTRRGSKVDILVPVDPKPDDVCECKTTASSCEIASEKQQPDSYIHMDAMAFGMGCCCLQVTMQTQSEDQSRYLHDQLAVLSPILQALSAATPIFKGQLAATDTRWNVISQAVDDRTVAERRGPASTLDVESLRDGAMVGEGVRRLSQSRYSEVPLFIARARSAAEAAALDALNDLDVAVDEEAFRMLHTEGGVDASMAKHVAHLFTRDPLVIFDDSIDLDNNNSQDHFENIQSTNWRSMRWKPPSLEVGLKNHELQELRALRLAELSSGLDGTSSPSSPLSLPVTEEERNLQQYGPGWRTEFRPLELQLTDFENSAYAQLVVLLSRMLLTSGYNLYMPMSYVHENMRRAQLKDAVLTQKFWFRRDALRKPPTSVCDGPNCAYSIPAVEDMDLVEMSVDEIMNGVAAGNGTEGHFPGLLPAVSAYVREHLVAKPAASHKSTEHPLQSYLELISRRASGALPTTARWMRNFVTRHPLYEPGSGRLHSLLANDLLQACDDIGMGRVQCIELYGDHTTRLVANIDQLSEQDLMCPKFEPYV